MTAEKIRNRINEICTHFLFDYNDKSCGVDPISHSHFDMWYGDNITVASSIEEVMSKSFFDGKALNEIYNEIKIVSW